VIQGKKIAIALGALCGVLGLVAGGQGVGLGSGYSLAEQEAVDAAPASLAALDREPSKMRPWSEYGPVLARPLFNESRAPEIEEAPAADAAAATQPLTVTLTGVILTRNMQLALVTDLAKGETERVRVGQPLTGERAGWTLIELRPRIAVFEGSGLGRQELELMVDTHGATPPAPAPAAVQPAATAPAQSPVPTPAAPAVAQAPGQPASAEEIRRRIEERRKQLREEAQKMLQQNSPQ
jgi:general secretion pathway protein N